MFGGTGLYINSLVYGIEYSDIKFDEEYRKKLEDRANKEGLDTLYKEACEIDKDAMKSISINDRKRIIRVLEIYKQTGKTKTKLDMESRKKGTEFNYKMFVINIEREILYDRINRRVDLMIKQGLVEEVKEILSKYDEFPTAMQALGYKETKDYLEGIISKEEMIDKIKMESRRYAKRQLTWFRKNDNAIWIENTDNALNEILEIIEN